MNQLLNWLVWSSQNSDKVSLTVSSGVAFLVLLGLDKATGDALESGVMGFLVRSAQTVAYAGVLVGAVRKIWNTGKNWWNK